MEHNAANFFSSSLNTLQHQYPAFFDQPVMRQFLEDSEHRKLLLEAVEQPSENRLYDLNEKFRFFFYRARVYKYLCSLISIYSVDFDKRERRRKERYQAILDRPAGDSEGGACLGELVEGGEEIPFDSLFFTDLASLFSDERLCGAIRRLTPKQKMVLTMSYVNDMPNKDIAAYFNESPQNISHIRKQAVSRIRKLCGQAAAAGKERKHCG